MITLTSAPEMQKPQSKRLNSDEPWDTFKAIGLEEIEKCIKKVVGIVAYKCEQVLNIIVVE
jgi:hypothetical protein